MRRIAAIFLRGCCMAALAAAVMVMPVFAGILSGGEGTVSVGQTVVTAQVIAEATPPEEPGREPPDQEPGSETAEEVPADELSRTPPLNDTAQSGVSAGKVNTGDASAGEPFLLLLVFSGIVIVAVKLRRIYLEEM